jgi:predicted nucleic acid-binding protein
MSDEFVDTNILIYAHDGGAGEKRVRSVALVTRLTEEGTGALSVQVLAEFYSAATRKLGMAGKDAEDIVADLRLWTIHRPGHADVVRSAQLQRRHKLAWWDALIVNSAMELGCGILWSEDLSDRRRFGSLTVRNPFG